MDLVSSIFSWQRHKSMTVDNYWIGVFARVPCYGLFFNGPIWSSGKILFKRSTDQESIIAYVRVMCLFSCLLSSWYGLGFDLLNKATDDWTAINVFGTLPLLVYVVVFILFSPWKEKARILGLLCSLLAVFGFVVLVSLYVLDGNTSRIFCGVAAAISNILMYASPLYLQATMVKNNSVEIMPSELSKDMFKCGTMWFIYGLLSHDLILAVPHGFGCILGIVQLVSYKRQTAEPSKIKQG